MGHFEAVVPANLLPGAKNTKPNITITKNNPIT